MGDLRKPFLVLALLASILVVLVELGSSLILGGSDAGSALTGGAASLGVDVGDVSGVSEPSGRGIAYLALVDVILLYTTILLTMSMIVPERVQGRVQGLVTLIGSIVLIIVAFVLLIIAFIELMIMVALFPAAPFGTIAYLALWGFFPVGDAAVLLSLLLFLKVAYAVLLILAQPRFLQNKGLVLLVLTSLACNVILAFLHGLMPVILVSILDDIGALIFAIIAIIWGIVLLIGSIPAVVKAVRATASLARS